MFHFELSPLSDCSPCTTTEEPCPTWFKLSRGRFHVQLGAHELYRYAPQACAHQGASDYVEYYLASLARDWLGAVAPVMARLPPFFEVLASDWDTLARLRAFRIASDRVVSTGEELAYTAWRWLAERSPWTSYLSPSPEVNLVRIEDDVHIHWDNRDQMIDGLSAWASPLGHHVMGAETFRAEARKFADRLTELMYQRIDEAALDATANAPSLRCQHEKWESEFRGYFDCREPDISWTEAEAAIRRIADVAGVPLVAEPSTGMG